jgi:hypothetical protein
MALKTDQRGNTRLLVKFPLSMRLALAETSRRIGLSQQSCIRSALAAFLEQYKEPEPDAPVKKPRARKGPKQ